MSVQPLPLAPAPPLKSLVENAKPGTSEANDTIPVVVLYDTSVQPLPLTPILPLKSPVVNAYPVSLG